jgi:hypothetical protein
MNTDIEVHPVAALFPMLPDDELADLATDIGSRGLLHPIVLDAGGRLLDGRNRLAACHSAGIAPIFVTYSGDDPAGYIGSVNIQRRHLSTGGRAVIAAEIGRLSGAVTRDVAARYKLYQPRIVEAGLILDHAPHLRDAVVSGDVAFSVALAEARAIKRGDFVEDHKIAGLFPQFVGEGFDALVESVREVGLIFPIWLYEGQILDGRARYRACLKAGVQPEFRSYTGTDPIAFSLSMNLHRDQLTEGQRAFVALDTTERRSGDPAGGSS